MNRGNSKWNSYWFSFIVSILTILVVLSCVAEEKIEISTVRVSPIFAAIETDSSQQFTAIVKDQWGEEMPDVMVTWTSSDTNVATINENGVATSDSIGKTEIRASAEGISGTAEFRIIEVTSILINPPTAKIRVDSVQQFTGIAFDQFNEEMSHIIVDWGSSDSTIAKVDLTTGLAVAVDTGSVDIIASVSLDSERVVSQKVELSIVEVIQVDVVPPTEIVGKKLTKQLYASALDQNKDTMGKVTVTWTSSDDSIATVDSTGLVTGNTMGVVNITASTSSKFGIDGIVEGESVVTVVSLGSIIINSSSDTLQIDSTLQYNATVLDHNEDEMSDIEVVWTSSDETVASIDEDGLAAGKSAGKTEIKASVLDVYGEIFDVTGTDTLTVVE